MAIENKLILGLELKYCSKWLLKVKLEH